MFSITRKARDSYQFCSGSLSLKKGTKFLLLLGELFRFLLI
jgi:hypothetical protein